MGSASVPVPAFTQALDGLQAAREAVIQSLILAIKEDQERIMAEVRREMARKLGGKPPGPDFAHQLHHIVYVVLEDHVYGPHGYTDIEDVIGTEGIAEVIRRVTNFIQDLGILPA